MSERLLQARVSIIGSCKYRNEKIGMDELELLRITHPYLEKGDAYHYYNLLRAVFTDGLKKEAPERGEVSPGNIAGSLQIKHYNFVDSSINML